MKRFATGLIIGLLWAALLSARSFSLLWLTFTAISGMALYEYFTMSLTDTELRVRPLAIVIVLIPCIAAVGASPNLVFASFYISLFASAMLLFVNYASLANGFMLLAKLSFGLAFISFGAAHLTLLAALPHGVAWLVILTIITIASDTGAYYAGSKFGKTKLCPAISPGKTLEGLVGGMVASLLLGLLARNIVLPEVPLIKMAAATIVVTLIGVGGDLIESIIKRSCRVKDSGTLLPGHGGVFDRIDSLLTAAPSLYYLIHLNLI